MSNSRIACFLAIGGSCLLLVLFVGQRKSARTSDELPQHMPSSMTLSNNNVMISGTTADRSLTGDTPQERGTPVVLFAEYAPLTAEEKETFNEEVRQKIRHLLLWRDPIKGTEAVTFQKTLFELADRGAADEARKLDALRAGVGLDETAAGDAIASVDTLQFLAEKGHPVSRKALLALASRPLVMEDSGSYTDRVAAIVTFEAFDGLAATDPTRAREVVESQTDSRVKPVLVYHYIVGRKLAGQAEKQAVLEARKLFGEKSVADIGIWNNYSPDISYP